MDQISNVNNLVGSIGDSARKKKKFHESDEEEKEGEDQIKSIHGKKRDKSKHRDKSEKRD